MVQAYLPKRKTGKQNEFADPPENRVWDERPKAHMATLASAIEVASIGHRIHSIPDPWARAILFERALFDEQHLLHASVLGEWRGVLALLGLRALRRFRGLTAREVSFGTATVPGMFSSVLDKLRPDNEGVISADTGWNKLHILRWQRQPFDRNRPEAFAFTSPTILVCTGSSYGNALDAQQIPWFNGAVLVDPVSHLGSREKTALAQWCLVLSQKITNSNWIVRRLASFADALDPAAPMPQDPEKFLSDDTLGLHHNLYRALDRAARGESHVGSDVEIVTTKPNAPRYLLIDPSLARQWNVSANEINVYGNVTLATSGHYTDSGQTSGTLPEDSALSWCTPEFFFADRLIFEKQASEAFPGCVPVKVVGDWRNVVLPLNRQVLELFTSAEIADSCTIEWLPNGGVSCALRLSIRAGNATRSVRIQKNFSDAEIVRMSDVPLIFVWPDFRLEGAWKTYFTLQFWPGEKQELSIKPWSATEHEPKAHRKHSLDNYRFQIYRNENHPEALVCTTPYFDAKQQRERKAEGILLLKMPPVAQKMPAASIVLGVDFGSTGSNVYVSTGHSRPEPVIFAKRVHPVTAFGDKEFDNFCIDEFIPRKDWPARSILSVFHDFGDPPDGSYINRQVLLDGNILYADDPQAVVGDKDRSRIAANLKWGGQRERILSKDFLTQLCLQAAAEVAYKGATAAEIRFSYPTAFSRDDLTVFKSNWRNVTGEVSKLTNVRLDLDVEQDVRNQEARCATRFFADHPGNADIEGDALIIDIGGGTSDFAVWKDMQLMAHSSVIFAGRDILLNPVRKKPQILAEVYPNIMLGQLQTGPRDDAFDAQLDAIVARYGEDMIKGLPVSSSQRSVQGLLAIIEVGLCGIAYYGGLLVRRLMESEGVELRRFMSIFIGGNGSKLFRWCSLGAPIELTRIADKTAAAFRSGAANDKLKIEIQLSPDPKAEVAYGLVRESQEAPGQAEGYARRMAGESFLIGNDKKGWGDWPEAEDIQNKRVKVDRSLPVFSAFLKSVGRSIDEYSLDKIANQIDGWFRRQAQDMEEKRKKDSTIDIESLIRNEPIYILALKLYLEMEIHAWENRF